MCKKYVIYLLWPLCFAGLLSVCIVPDASAQTKQTQQKVETPERFASCPPGYITIGSPQNECVQKDVHRREDMETGQIVAIIGLSVTILMALGLFLMCKIYTD